MTTPVIALVAVAVVVLALLIVGWGKLVQQEIRSQRLKRDTPEPQFTYRHGRTYYGDTHAARMKARAARRKAAALKQADGKVIEMAAHRRRA